MHYNLDLKDAKFQSKSNNGNPDNNSDDMTHHTTIARSSLCPSSTSESHSIIHRGRGRVIPSFSLSI